MGERYFYFEAGMFFQACKAVVGQYQYATRGCCSAEVIKVCVLAGALLGHFNAFGLGGLL